MTTTRAKLIKRYQLTMNHCEEERSYEKEGGHAIVEDTQGENAGGGGANEE